MKVIYVYISIKFLNKSYLINQNISSTVVVFTLMTMLINYISCCHCDRKYSMYFIYVIIINFMT